MQYDDPHNLDFDILIQIGDEFRALPESRYLEFDLNDQLLEVWERDKVGIDGQLVFGSNSRLQRALQIIDEGDTDEITHEPYVFYTPISDVPKILTGLPFFVTDPDGLRTMKAASLSAIDTYPVVSAITRETLEFTHAIREERAATSGEGGSSGYPL